MAEPAAGVTRTRTRGIAARATCSGGPAARMRPPSSTATPVHTPSISSKRCDVMKKVVCASRLTRVI
jgi:hypothetical protein